MELDAEYPSVADLYLDGNRSKSYVRRSAEPKPMTMMHGVVSETSSAPFIFSPLDVTGGKEVFFTARIPKADNGCKLDDDAYLDASPSHSIGEIKLVIIRTTIPKILPVEEKKTENRPKEDRIISLSRKIHERSKKGIAHQIKFVASLTA